MIAKTYLNFLERNRLINQAKQNRHYFRRVVLECLNPEPDQDVLIVGDQGYMGRRVAALSALGYYLAASELGYKAKLVLQRPKVRGDRADQVVINELAKLPDESVVILNMSSRLGSIDYLGKSYRAFCKKHHHRFVSMTNVAGLQTKNLHHLTDSIDVDYEDMRHRSRQIKSIFDKGNELLITSPNGTDITMNIKGCTAISNDGDYQENGEGGNLPAGEVYIPPKKKGVDGTIVVDGSCTHLGGTYLLKDTITLTVENGSIVDIKDKTAGRLLRNTLAWAQQKAAYPENVSRIGEFGYGTNKRSAIVGATIIDEKTHGTAHFAIGSNYWFGGDIYTIIHLDQVFRKPTVYVDGEILPWL